MCVGSSGEVACRLQPTEYPTPHPSLRECAREATVDAKLTMADSVEQAPSVNI